MNGLSIQAGIVGAVSWTFFLFLFSIFEHDGKMHAFVVRYLSHLSNLLRIPCFDITNSASVKRTGINFKLLSFNSHKICTIWANESCNWRNFEYLFYYYTYSIIQNESTDNILGCQMNMRASEKWSLIHYSICIAYNERKKLHDI